MGPKVVFGNAHPEFVDPHAISQPPNPGIIFHQLQEPKPASNVPCSWTQPPLTVKYQTLIGLQFSVREESRNSTRWEICILNLSPDKETSFQWGKTCRPWQRCRSFRKDQDWTCRPLDIEILIRNTWRPLFSRTARGTYKRIVSAGHEAKSHFLWSTVQNWRLY